MAPVRSRSLKEERSADRKVGGGQTRTGEDRSRGIYSPLQLPLCDTPTKCGAGGRT